MTKRTLEVCLVSVLALFGSACDASTEPPQHTRSPSSTPPAATTSEVVAAPVDAPCGVDLRSPILPAAIRQLTPEPMTKQGWNTDPASFRGNYDPCAPLSAAIITINGATGSSPDQVLLFQRGRYLGTATSKAHGYTSFDPARTTPDTVGVHYKTPGTCGACNDGVLMPVQYHWDGHTVHMIGNPPQ